MEASPPIQIDVHELARWRREGIAHAVVDVREPWETALCLIEGSLAIPLASIPSRSRDLPRDVPLVLVCHHGMRSMQAVTWLRRNDVGNAVNLAGGIDAWARQNDPAMAVY